MLLDQVGDPAGAERLLRSAVDLLQPLAELPAEPKFAHSLAIANNNLSFVLRNRDAEAAADASQQAISILKRLVENNPNQVDYHNDLALCYNNLAAMESQGGRLNAAIDWHERAIALQEQMARKSPAVVRHRSDLAVSFNNLGVAYCRADQAAKADAAFGRARELLATLADDYPDELAYGSSLAALLNNQALALAGAGRHEDALKIYPTAIAAQSSSYERLPESGMLRDVLSKMYYNYGQSLRKMGRLQDAANVALQRRSIWRGNGERLLGVAAELAEIGHSARDPVKSTDFEPAPKSLDDEVIETLRQANAAGWPRQIDLATDERFAYLRNHKGFAALVAEVSATSGGLSAAEQGGRQKSPSSITQ
jgi:tetratricopeptide (TPR) repeat protein